MTAAAEPLCGAPPPEPLRRIDLAVVAASRVIASAAVLLAGFRAVSDDDYSRVVIAQSWALAPKLDPSGTSWLPFPFWLNGAVMLVVGRSLLVAQIVALVLGVATSLLVALAAHRLTGDRRASVIAGCFASLLGWSAWLGVATVPEALTAALTLFAASSLASRSPRHRMEGALALFAATLSRYEPWSIALAFAVWNLVDAARRRRREEIGARTFLGSLAASVVAIAGPIAWIAWNAASHGDPFHFIARVTAYRRALGVAAPEGVLDTLASYPAAFAREMPEVVAPFALVLLLLFVPRYRSVVAACLKQSLAPLSLAALQIVALSAALVKDGAPTHHPERTLLFPAFALAAFTAHAASRLGAQGANASKVGPLWKGALAIAAALLLSRTVATPLLRPQGFIDRRDEVAMGAHIAKNVPPGERVYLTVEDYGYYATLAASGRPEDFAPDRDLDPRRPAEAGIPPSSILVWLQDHGFRYIVRRLDLPPPVAPGFFTAEPLFHTRYRGIWRVP